MNYLAHLYLSGDDIEIQLGNFIGDFVKGDEAFSFPEKVTIGVLHHRSIDYFTDRHPAWKRSKTRLFEQFRHYGAVLVDIYYDHFLAAQWDRFHPVPLHQYTREVYNNFTEMQMHMPQRSQNMLPYMIRGNWLYNYQFIEGVENVLNGMSRRASRGNNLQNGASALLRDYENFKLDFETFFPELEAFAKEELTRLKKLYGNNH